MAAGKQTDAPTVVFQIPSIKSITAYLSTSYTITVYRENQPMDW